MSDLSNVGGRPEDAQRYKRALLSLLADRDPIEVLREAPQRLSSLLSELEDAELRRPEVPGKWSILEVAHHLADSELAWSWRLRTVLADEQPVLSGYDQNRWAARFGYRSADPADVCSQFDLLRRLNLRILDSLSDSDHARVGLHSERGEESVGEMIVLYAGHDLVHLRQIERIRGTDIS